MKMLNEFGSSPMYSLNEFSSCFVEQSENIYLKNKPLSNNETQVKLQLVGKLRILNWDSPETMLKYGVCLVVEKAEEKQNKRKFEAMQLGLPSFKANKKEQKEANKCYFNNVNSYKNERPD